MINGKYIKMLCMDMYNITLEDKVKELIKPYQQKNGMIKNKEHRQVILNICDVLYDMVSIAAVHDDTEQILTMINITVTKEIKDKYYKEDNNKDNKNDRLYEEINKMDIYTDDCDSSLYNGIDY